MRDKLKPASLGELMGEGFEHRNKLTLEDLPKILGEKMPEITYDRVGKIRLLNALQIRFGDGFANIPGIKDLMKQFQAEMQAEAVVRMNRRKKNG